MPQAPYRSLSIHDGSTHGTVSAGRGPVTPEVGRHCYKSGCRFVFALLLLAHACAAQSVWVEPPEEYLIAGERALEWTREFVDLGPRPAGSESLAVEHEIIIQALSRLSCAIEVDAFVAKTPVGALLMRNIIARFGPPGDSPVMVVSGHYDTLRMDGFVGANDGGSSAGFLMALAERLDRAGQHGVWLVFFDGEESTVQWRDLDHTYGSRRLAARWIADDTVSRIRALINVDMIGDADLELVFEGNSDPILRETVWDLGSDLGYGRSFGRSIGYIEDDHIPFLRAGVPSLVLIDFNYGPRNSYWHTQHDTIDKLDRRSFATVMHVIEAAIEKLLAN